MERTQPGPARLLGRAVMRRCPVCAERHIWSGYFRLREHCPRCRFRFERREGQFVGAVGVSTILTFGLLLATTVVGLVLTWPDVAVLPMLVAGLVVAVLVPVVIHPVATMLWLALDLIFVPLRQNEAPSFGRGTVDAPEGPRQER